MKLGNYCTIVRGSSPRPQGDSRYFGGNIPRLMIADVTRDGMTVYPKIDSLTEEGAIKSRLMKKGDFIIAVSGDPGRPCILGVDACIHDGFVGLRNLDNTKIFKPFLYYFFLKIKESNKKNAVGAIFKNFTTDQIKSIEIPTIPLTDQIKIAQVLTQAEKLIAQRKESIALLDEYLKSTFLEMFGDPSPSGSNFRKGKIRDVVSEVKYGTSRPSIENGVYPYLRMNNITTNGYMDYSSLKYIDVSDDEKEKYVVRKGDLLFNRTNSKELVGKTGVYFEDSEMIIAGYLLRVRTNNNANPWFLWGYLNSAHGKQTLSSMCKSIVGMANINAQEFQEINIVIPPIKLQNQFAQIVEKTEALKSQYQQSLRELEQLFGSLSQRAFKGELDLSRVEVSEGAYQPSEPPPVPTVPQPEKIKKERPKAAKKADAAVSIWVKNRKKGKTGKVPFTNIEGNAVLSEFFDQGKGFHFQAFETFLKNEGFEYEFEQVKDFLFEKLEQQELLQYYSNVEWMEERYRQEIGSDEDDFLGDGQIWLIVNKKGTP